MDTEQPLPSETVEGLLRLGLLSLQFGRVERAVLHEDKETVETDTDHTVMLGLIACAYADAYAPHLDKGKIAQFALVHDFVEVYAGDTPTMRIQTADQKHDKEEREAAALARLKEEFDHVFPWLTRTIEEYERLDTPEARFVKFVDKVLPKISHGLNAGEMLKRQDFTQEDMAHKLRHQFEDISAGYGADQPEAKRLFASLAKYVEKAVFGKE